MCDDIDLTVEGHQIIEAKRACVLGNGWFLNHDIEDRPACLIHGQPASVADGIEKAAADSGQRQVSARLWPVRHDGESQRVAVGIADWIGGNVDTTTSVCHGPSGMAFQGVGEVTASLGEVRNRGDLIMFWGSNPAESHPRHFTKYSLMPKGQFLPNGRKDRTAVIVDVRKTKSAKAADIFIQIKPRADFEGLWTLRALANDIELDPAQVEADTGVPLATWQDLMNRMKRAKFGVLFFGMGVTMTRGKHANSEAVLALTRDMNKHTRFVCKPNRGHGNVTGADNVVTWRTGYPVRRQPGPRLSALQSGRIHGRRRAGPRRSRRRPDRRQRPDGQLQPAGPRAPEVAFPTSRSTRKRSPTTRHAAVAFTVATYGINVPGTVYRMDDVPIPLRPAFDSPFPSDFEILTGHRTAREAAPRDGQRLAAQPRQPAAGDGIICEGDRGVQTASSRHSAIRNPQSAFGHAHLHAPTDSALPPRRNGRPFGHRRAAGVGN